MSKKTTEEIMKGLEICTNNRIGCDECPYDGTSECGSNLKKDALHALKGQPVNHQDEDKLTGIKEKPKSKPTKMSKSVLPQILISMI